VLIAEILRERGNRGEVLVTSLSDVPGRIENLKKATVRLPDGTDVQVEIEKAWIHGEHWVLKFAGVDSISDAQRFRSSELWVPQEERGTLPAGEYFQSDLLGCVLRDERTGLSVGKIRGFQKYGGPLLLELDVEGREVLVPFVPEICPKVDLETKTIGAILPDGLLDL
jgi:16S rRNA processing protein RimM